MTYVATGGHPVGLPEAKHALAVLDDQRAAVARAARPAPWWQAVASALLAAALLASADLGDAAFAVSLAGYALGLGAVGYVHRLRQRARPRCATLPRTRRRRVTTALVLVVVGGLTNLALHDAGVAHPNALTGGLLALGYLVGTAWLRRATRQDLATTGPLLEPWPPR